MLREALAESLGNTPLGDDVRRCESSAGVEGILRLASQMPEFIAAAAHLDADPYLLNCANGTVDLHTMELRKADPDDRITKICRAPYVAGEPGDIWAEFIRAVLPDDELREFVQRLIGLSLLGRVVEHVLPIWTGTGANGKGTLYKALLWAFGDYAGVAEADLFMHREGAHPTGEMDLRGMRLAVVSESDKDRKQPKRR